jgi:hypothetical protein
LLAFSGACFATIASCTTVLKPSTNRRPLSVPHKVVPLLKDPNYANFLRVVGQALEILNVAEFDLRIINDDCVINSHFLPAKLGSLAKRQIWIPGVSRHRTDSGNREIDIEFKFTPAEICRLAQEFGRRRGNPNRNLDSFGVAELLRVVGHYLDLKKVSLLGIFRREQFLTLRYAADAGSYKQEYFQSSFFYSLFVKMYIRRSNRASQTNRLNRPDA